MLTRHRGWPSVWTVAFETERVRCAGAEEMQIVAAVRLMTSGASDFECRLMMDGLLHQFRLVAVAVQTSTHRIGLQEPGGFAGMRVMAGMQSPCAPGCWTLAE